MSNDKLLWLLDKAVVCVVCTAVHINQTGVVNLLILASLPYVAKTGTLGKPDTYS